MKSVPPAPPYCSGTSIPISPRSKYLGRRVGSILPAFSISATRGRTSSSANAATASRNMTSSSERSVRAVGEDVVSVCTYADACSLENDFGQLLVQPERRRHAEAHLRETPCDVRDHPRDVRRRMTSW